MTKILMKGNEAMAEAAIRAGAINYFCYPITPQSEVAEYLAKRMPEVGGVYLQAESETAVGNMLYGAAATGQRAFTSSSSPGISLMQETISYAAGTQLPCVIINVMRAGPGLGGILPGQADYFQATRGGGHGDYRTLALAPSTVQEAVDLVMLSFYLADKYTNPVTVVADGMIGQMMEPVAFPENYTEPKLPPKDWAATGAKGRPPRILKSLYLDPILLEKNNLILDAKYEQMKKEEIRFERYKIKDDNRLLLVAYGSMARICQTAIDELEQDGLSIGLFRPITLYPFGYAELRAEATRKNIKKVLTVEMSMGQMIEDVQRAVGYDKPVEFFGRSGGLVPSPDEVKQQIISLIAPKKGRSPKKAAR